MSQNLNNDYKEYDAKVNNLINIFTKVRRILDISKYRYELDKIQQEANAEHISFEDISYNIYNERLDILLNTVEKEVLPLYELYLLSSKIDIQISNVMNEDINNIIENTKELINSLNSINTYNNKDANYLIDKAYKTIYSVIIHEEIFNRNDILSYINDLNITLNKEKIGKLVLNDINGLSDQEIVNIDFQNLFLDEELRNIDNDGLGYDYLNSDFIRKISKNIVGKKYLEFDKKRKEVISDISSKVNIFTRKNNLLLSDLNKNNMHIKNLYINKSLLLTKALSVILVPIITFSAGRMIGKNASNKITEYKTVTRTIDLNTRDVVGDIDYVYDEKETTYVATVMKCSPWRSNPSGDGYIRNVTAYEYIPNGMDGIHDVTNFQLEGNMLEKYVYIESKESLDKNDSTSETTILLTETYQDKNDNRKSTKYVLPLSIVGAGIGIAIDVALVFLELYDIHRIKEIFDKLDKEIKEYKLSNKQINDRLNSLMDENLRLHDEYNNAVKKYGHFDIKIVPSDTESTSINTVVRKRKIKR